MFNSLNFYSCYGIFISSKNERNHEFTVFQRRWYALLAVSQLSQIIPIFGVFALVNFFTISFMILMPLPFFLNYLHSIIWQRFDRKYRFIGEATTKDYFLRNLPTSIAFFPSLSILILAVHFIPIYFPRYSDPLEFIVYYAAIIMAIFLVSPIQAIFSNDLAEINAELTERFRKFATTFGIRNVQIYSVPWSKFKVANAFQMGPALSYTVHVTDYLLENMNDKEMDFVILHELFHARRKHILKLVLEGSLVIFLLYNIKSVPFDLIGNPIIEIVAILSYLFFLLAAFPLLIAFFSRRHEMEADIFAVKFSMDPMSAVSALKKLDELNVRPFNFQRNKLLQSHPAIDKRIENILKFSKNTLVIQ